MAQSIMKTSFAGGELSPSLAGRIDFDKYEVGAAVMRNFFVDFRGGASTRPGTQHVGQCALRPGDPKPRLIPFVFSADQAYALELHAGVMRVVFRGAYVTETPRNITAASRGAVTTFTVTAHGFAVGQFLYVRGCNGLARPNGISGVNGRLFHVGAVTTNTITVQEYGPSNNYVPVVSSAWSAWTSGGTVERVYEVPTPWAGANLFELNFAQSADIMTVVHPDFPAHEIRRLGNANWQVVQQTYGASVSAPTGATAVAVNNSGAPQRFYAYVVTTVDSAGRESTPTDAITVLNRALDQIVQPNVVNTITWTPRPGAYKYRIYKANPLPSGQQGGGPYVYGLVGTAFEPRFVDVNYGPQFETGPPQGRNPFLDRGVASATITNSGQGYIAPVLTIADSTGSGASVALASDTSITASPYGEVVSSNVIAGGTNYTAPVATITDAAPLGSGLVLAFSGAWVPNPLGTGFVPAPGSITIATPGSNYHQASYANFVRATATDQVGTNVLLIDVTSVEFGRVQSIGWANSDITPTATTGLSATGGTDTITFAIVGVDIPASGATATLALGGTTNPSVVAYFEQRAAFAGSRDAPATFWLSRPGQFTNFDVSDPVQDDDAITASLFAQEVNAINSLTAMTNGLIALSSGGAYLITGGVNDAAVTPSTVRAPPQAFSGAQPLTPLRVGDHIIYAQARGSAVRDLAYQFSSNNFTGTDISVLSGHLLEGRKIVQWAHAEEPHKIVWAARDDGVLLSLTYLRDQQVFGWARHDTQGEVVSVCVVPEDREDVLYLVVRRFRPLFGYQYHVERMASRLFGANPAANIAAQAEEAWCVDGGAEFPLVKPGTAIVSGRTLATGALYTVTIDAGGSGYAGTLIAEIADMTGAGGQIVVAQTAGVITSATITVPGAHYSTPRVTVRGSAGGSGAELSVRVVTTVRLEVEGAPFSAADVGKIARVRGGRGPVLAVPSANTLDVDFFDALPSGTPNLPGIVLPRVPAGEWSLTTPVQTIGGLDHLNSSVVQVLADGNVQTPRTVVDGCIVLEEPATRIIVGQGYTCQLQTMRLEIAPQPSQGARKLISNMHVRVRDTRGLFAGSSWDALTEIKEREDEAMGQPVNLQQGGGAPLPAAYPNAPTAPKPLWYADRYAILPGSWDEEGVVCIQQSYPLPATVLAVMPAIIPGDTGR